jgi:hypothetical protein
MASGPGGQPTALQCCFRRCKPEIGRCGFRQRRACTEGGRAGASDGELVPGSGGHLTAALVGRAGLDRLHAAAQLTSTAKGRSRTRWRITLEWPLWTGHSLPYCSRISLSGIARWALFDCCALSTRNTTSPFTPITITLT